MEGDAAHRFRAEMPFAELLVPILVRAAGVLAVVEVHGAQPVEPDDLVEARQHAVEVADDIVSRVPDVAGVEAHAELLAEPDAVDDLPELFEGTADLRALARHRFEQNGRPHSRGEDAVQRLGDQLDPFLNALTGMRAGVKVVVVAGEVFHPFDVLLQHIQPVRSGRWVRGAEVHRVAAVSDELAEVFFFQQGVERRRVLFLPPRGLRVK